MEINITWNICRICLQEERKNVSGVEASEPRMHNLFEENKKLAKYIYEFTGIFMKPNDSLPDKICLKCLKMINNAIHFRKTCINSNTYLLSILERTQKASSLFKPEGAAENITDNELYDDDDNDEEDEKMFVEEKNWHEIDVENSNLEKHEKKKDNLDDDKHKEYESNDSIENLDEIIEHFEDSSTPTDVTCTITVENTTEDSIPNRKQCKEQNQQYSVDDEKKIKTNTTQLQKFLMNAKFNEVKETHKAKVDQRELYYLIEDMENESSNDKPDELRELDETQLIMADDNVEIYEIEEPEEENLMLHTEDENDENNQAQVTSTVDTNDEAIYSEENSQESNTSKDLEDIVSDNNSQKSSVLQSSKNNVTRSIKRKASTKHLGRVDGSANVCAVCGNQFQNRAMLKLHMRIHNQERNHQCEICYKSFITACNLQAHMRIHTGEKPYECKFCGRRFSDRTSHIRHERTHTNEKPFKCSNCNKNFSLATTLQNHIKVHTNERSYRCEPCGKSFKLSHHLKTHENTSLHRSVMLIGSKNN